MIPRGAPDEELLAPPCRRMTSRAGKAASPGTPGLYLDGLPNAFHTDEVTRAVGRVRRLRWTKRKMRAELT